MNDVPRRRASKPPAPDLLEPLMSTAGPAAQPILEASRKRPLRSGPFGVLDVGSSKIGCLIGRADADGTLRVIGSGLREARGVKAGGIVDLEEAFSAIQAVIAEAEQKASHRLHGVTVNLSCGRPQSRLIELSLAMGGRVIGEADIRRVVHEAARRTHVAGRDNIHVLPLEFDLDETKGVTDPRDMRCETLIARLHVIDAAASSVSNLITVLDRCNLVLEELVSAPMASALATLVEDERQLGATVIDMGGGGTTIAIFGDGELLHTAHLPVGGQHVTNDIARLLSTPVREAERLKTFYGSVQPSPDDEREMLPIPLVGEDEFNVHKVARSEVIRIIEPRLEETFDMVKAEIERSERAREAGNRVVLTGGASQLPGVREMASRRLDRQVRLGRPSAPRGLPEAATGPGFATACGLLTWASGAGRHFADLNLDDDSKPSLLQRIVNFIMKRI